MPYGPGRYVTVPRFSVSRSLRAAVPKEGYSSVTLPDELLERCQRYIDEERGGTIEPATLIREGMTDWLDRQEAQADVESALGEES